MNKFFSFLIAFSILLASAEAGDPSPQEILEKAIAAMGGQSNLEKLQTRSATAKVEVRGLTGTYEMWAKAPDRLKTKLDLGVVQQERGFDGTKGWQKQTNVQELVGPELERLKRSAVFQPVLTYWKNKTPAVLKGKEKIDSLEVYAVEFKPSTASPPEIFYFDTSNLYLVRELRKVTIDSVEQNLVIDYGDYRKVQDVLLPYSIKQSLPDQVIALNVQEYKVNEPIDDSVFKSPLDQFADVPYDVTVSTIPKNIYKEDDGVWGAGTTESWVVHILVQEKHMRPLQPVAARVEFYAEDELVKIQELSPDALEAVRGTSFGGFNNIQEVFDLRHAFSEPLALGIDKMVYKLNMVNPKDEKIQKKLEIPLKVYEQKTELLFPIKGPFFVAGGHDANEPHKTEWSQHYAYDIVGLGPRYELFKTAGKTNDDYYTWGKEVLAAADGKVVYVRNDVPDNKAPGTVDTNAFMNMPDPIRAFPGNNVVIDHGNGEFSFYAHLKQGSVKVKAGDTVKKGDVIALLGNSGNSDGPHLHFQLMSGDMIFRNDGLPATFANVEAKVFTTQPEKIANPKRGVLLDAK